MVSSTVMRAETCLSPSESDFSPSGVNVENKLVSWRLLKIRRSRSAEGYCDDPFLER